jgi:hypothetical protein
LVFGEVKDLLAEQLENLHVVLAEDLGGLGAPHEVGDEGGPVVRPFLFEDLNEGEVEFGDEDLFFGERGFVGGELDHFSHYVCFDALTLFWGEDLPSSRFDIN